MGGGPAGHFAGAGFLGPEILRHSALSLGVAIHTATITPKICDANILNKNTQKAGCGCVEGSKEGTAAASHSSRHAYSYTHVARMQADGTAYSAANAPSRRTLWSVCGCGAPVSSIDGADAGVGRRSTARSPDERNTQPSSRQIASGTITKASNDLLD